MMRGLFESEEVEGRSQVVLWLGAESLTAEFAGETLTRYEVVYSPAAGGSVGGSVGGSIGGSIGGSGGRVREGKNPRLFATRYHHSPQLRLIGLEDVLGEAGWLKAMRIEEYARRNTRQTGTLQGALFSYASTIVTVEAMNRGECIQWKAVMNRPTSGHGRRGNEPDRANLFSSLWQGRRSRAVALISLGVDRREPASNLLAPRRSGLDDVQEYPLRPGREYSLVDGRARFA